MDLASGKIELSERYIKILNCDHILQSHDVAVYIKETTALERQVVTAAIAFLVWNLSNRDHSLFPDWNGMPYK